MFCFDSLSIGEERRWIAVESGGGRVHVCGTSVSNVKSCQNRQTYFKRFNSCFQFLDLLIFIYLWFSTLFVFLEYAKMQNEAPLKTKLGFRTTKEKMQNMKAQDTVEKMEK
ncbi:hypothetical protein V8G54_021026 [Vigna mungo]|uniref:Uncharacterized protein n=1 Tax=Vigna mungo TaxID=3915 RepID=A0AAQ3NCN7_VIGMU